MHWLRFLCTAGILLSSLEAAANFVGNDTSNFNPVSSGLDFITVNSTQTLLPGVINTGLFFNIARNTLPATVNATGKVSNDPNDKVVFGDVSFAIGVIKDLHVGTSISYLAQQSADPVAGSKFSATGLNEIRLNLNYTVLERKPVGFGLIGTININQTNNNPFAGQNGGPTFNLEAAADFRWWRFLFAANAGYRLRERGTQIPNAVYEPLPDQFIFSGAGSLYLDEIHTKLVGELYAAMPSESVRYVKKGQISSEILCGAKWDIGDSLAINAGLGTRLGNGLFTPDWRAYAGLNFGWGGAGIRARAAESQITESPAIANVTNYYEGYQPQEIESLKPVDFDEIARTHEFKLRTAVTEKDFEGAKPPFEIVRLDGFSFDTASDKIKPEYHTLLNTVADYLSKEPKVLKIRVEGHTDSMGDPNRNLKLSQRRANALLKYIREHGLNAEIETEAAGYGPSRPIADNGNFQGRAVNRRSEIRILRTLEPVRAKVEQSK